MPLMHLQHGRRCCLGYCSDMRTEVAGNIAHSSLHPQHAYEVDSSSTSQASWRLSQGWIQSSSSDLHKSLKFLPNLISQLFIAVNEISYPPCFIVYYEINKTTERLFPRSHSKPSPSRAKWTSHRSRGFVLCWSFENHAKRNSQARPDKVST